MCLYVCMCVCFCVWESFPNKSTGGMCIMCMYACVCVFVFANRFQTNQLEVRVSMCMYVRVFVFVFVCESFPNNAIGGMCIYVCACKSVCVCNSVCVCVCQSVSYIHM